MYKYSYQRRCLGKSARKKTLLTVTITTNTTTSMLATLLILSFVMMLVLPPQLLYQSVYGARQMIPDGVAIAASEDNVYLTWPSNKTGNWEVLFRASNDSGNTFTDKISLNNLDSSSSSEITFQNAITVYEDNVHVSWNDNKPGSVETYVITSTDGGKTFDKTIKINGTGTGPQQFEPIESSITPGEDILYNPPEATKLAVSGDNVYVLSWDKKSGNWEVFFAKSSDGGQTFEYTINMSNSTDTHSDDAHLVAEEDNVYISWWETSNNGTRTPYFIASNDNGESFGPVLKVGANGTIGGTL